MAYYLIVRIGSNSSSNEKSKYKEGTRIAVITQVGKKQKQTLILYYD